MRLLRLAQGESVVRFTPVPAFKTDDAIEGLHAGFSKLLRGQEIDPLFLIGTYVFDFLLSWFQEEDYRKEFTDALRDYVTMGNFKYPMYTDKIYVSIFRGNAKEYRKILQLHTKDN